jgi:hypothetical protein
MIEIEKDKEKDEEQNSSFDHYATLQEIFRNEKPSVDMLEKPICPMLSQLCERFQSSNTTPVFEEPMEQSVLSDIHVELDPDLVPIPVSTEVAPIFNNAEMDMDMNDADISLDEPKEIGSHHEICKLIFLFNLKSSREFNHIFSSIFI